MTQLRKLSMSQATGYLIIVQGQLDPGRADWFNGMIIEARHLHAVPVTYLRGVVRDQAALQGMLRNLYMLGMPLLAVCLTDGESLCPPDIYKSNVTVAEEEQF